MTACEAADKIGLIDLLDPLYARHPGWNEERDAIMSLVATAARERSEPLRRLDQARVAHPAWFGAPDMIGYSFYVDRFADDLPGLRARLSWLDALGVRLLHPLPMTRSQGGGDSDGGFAVADYRAIDPALGSVEDVRVLAVDLHGRGMALAMDCVLNHCARDHEWAQAALAGDPVYRDYFHILAEADAVNLWEARLDEVFPDTAPGNFTCEPALGGWVWTTFYPFQWDLNWSNPSVFREMLGVLLFWANVGIDAFRLDSAPFLWKRDGTNCRNQPETHMVVAALRAALDIATPGVALIAEAIERIEEVMPYLEPEGGMRACQIAYHNGAMAAIWLALATGDAKVLATLVEETQLGRSDTAWLTYLRCHDDIIWSALGGVVPAEALDRCSAFYAGEGDSFARGLRFQARVDAAPSTVGMLASLIGGDGPDAVARYRLLLGTLLALPGMPMLYMGDEIGLPNDLSAGPSSDARWLHRPSMNWSRAALAEEHPNTADTFLGITRRMIATRRSIPGLDAKSTCIMHGGDPATLMIERGQGDDALLVVAYFGDGNVPFTAPAGWHGALHDRLTDMTGPQSLEPMSVFWLFRESQS